MEIEVLREAKSGLLGFGASAAVVRLTPRSGAGKPAVKPASGADGGAAADRRGRSDRGRGGPDQDKDKDKTRGSDDGAGKRADAGRGSRQAGSDRAAAASARSQAPSAQPAVGPSQGPSASAGDGTAAPERRRRRRRRRPGDGGGRTESGERAAGTRSEGGESGGRARGAAARSGVGSRDTEERQGYSGRGREGGGRSRSGRGGPQDRGRGRGERGSTAPVEKTEYEPRGTFSLPTGAPFDVASSVLGTLLTELGFEGYRIERGADLLPKEAGMEDESDVVSIHGGGTEALLDEEGDSLDALQFVTRLIVSQATGEWATVLVDVEDDRRRQIEELFSLAQQSADLVESDGRAVSLPPMNAYERRVVHIALRDHPTIATQSIGEGDRRKVTVRRRDQLLPEL